MKGSSTSDVNLGPYVVGNWFVIRVPLAQGWQAVSRSNAGVNVIAIDIDVPDHGVRSVVDQMTAAAAGDWDNAPNISRPRPQLSVVR